MKTPRTKASSDLTRDKEMVAKEQAIEMQTIYRNDRQ